MIPSRYTQALRLTAVVACSALLLNVAWHMARCVAHPFPIEYGEGVNLLWSGRAASGLALYPDIEPDAWPQLHNPYPPAGPLAIAALTRIGLHRHPFMAGRLLAIAGVLLGSGGIYGMVRRRSGTGVAVYAVCVFLLSPVVFRFGPLMRIDPFALGLALQAVNLVDRRPNALRMAAAGLLATLAICCKPTFLAAALALCWVSARRRSVRLVGAFCLGGSVPLVGLAIGLWSGHAPPYVFQHLVVLHRLPLDPVATLGWVALFSASHAPAIAAAACGGLCQARWRLQPAAGLLPVYACAGLAVALCAGLVTGSAEHYALEPWAVTAIAAALVWDRLRRAVPAGAYALLIMQALLFLPLPPAPVFTRTYGQEVPAGARAAWTPSAADSEIGRMLISELASSDGPILSSDIGFLLLAGHDPVYQPYQFEQLVRGGRWPSEPLVRKIEAGAFPVIVLKGCAALRDDPFFTDAVQQAIHNAYLLHRVLGPWHVYRR